MPAILILIVLVSGFTFTTRYPLARYKQSRSSGWDSYFHVTAWGVFISLISAIILLGLTHIATIQKLEALFPSHASYAFAKDVITPKYCYAVAWSVICLIVSYALGTSLEFIWKNEAIALVAAEDDFEKLLFESMARQQLIQVTLKSGKAYIGLISEQDGSKDFKKRAYISMLPYLSGYRDDKLILQLTNNYHKHYKNISDDNSDLIGYRVVLPISEINTAAFFDVNAFLAIQTEQWHNHENNKQNTIDAQNVEAVEGPPAS
ncbi:hypothetical protein ACFFU8_18265 [Chromobacterium piscinae]|uniref:hypothetical protein n=1 Tax=Chromobacterium piscinae TaxID=686831 RepID=UPI001E36A907|nr:hypothetical protein [Chromobacterium piscinae]MCD5326739.1 hypothetical protein [Chromobacterium piscinae]